jgi:hypothetical protein
MRLGCEAMKRSVHAGVGTILATALLVCSCGQKENLPAFTDAVRRADKLVLYEGLPHQESEEELMKAERRTKAVQELNGYYFYSATLDLKAEDGKRLSEILSNPATFEPYRDNKKCDGFHPDYAVEYQLGTDKYRALLCFGCHEVKLIGPGMNSRHDLEYHAYEALKETLKDYRKNRPPRAG